MSRGRSGCSSKPSEFYEDLEFHLADSATYRTFCGLGYADPAPSKSTLHRNIKALSDQTLEAIHRMTVDYALREGIDTLTPLRFLFRLGA